MKSIHASPIQVAALAAAVWVACAGGCRNPPAGLPNPFLAPDRVPPPATRALAPGQAQPYYPGDPLPVMQSSLAPSAIPGTIGPDAAARSPGSDALTWNSPRGTSPAVSAGNGPGPGALAWANEPAVAIPSDGDSLRFALPPAAPSPPAVTAPQQPAPMAAAPTSPSVVPAAYLVPPSNGQPAVDLATANDLSARSTGPWRSPEFAPPASPGSGVGQPTLPTSAATTFQPNTMDVRLRAVPSPPPEPVEPTTPRIRFPGHAAPQATTGTSAVIPAAPSYATVDPTNQLLQTVQIGPLPPPPASAAASPPASADSFAGRDGFRPRSRMR